MTHQESDVRSVLAGASRSKYRARVAIGAVLLVAIAAAGAYLRFGRMKVTSTYVEESVTRGPLTVTVTATGQLESLNQVTVGTEISGVVEKVLVDYNSKVKVGQLLAIINTDKLRAQQEQSRAVLQSAEAGTRQQEATVAEARAQLRRLEQVFELSDGRVPSRQELEAQQATVARAEADLASAQANARQSAAALSANSTDLRKAEIRSPISGIVLERKVDPGQTVAASFSTPTMFTLAEDLTRMKLSVAVDEADIGEVRVGQEATFRVDAYPNRRFTSRVTDVRSTSTTSSGVVTYAVILSVDNAGLLLKPGMTATAEIAVTQIADALLVPNSALRFTPPAVVAPSTSLLPAPPGNTARKTTDDPEAGKASQVWIQEEKRLRSIAVVTGPSNGQVTQVIGSALQPGMRVIVDLVERAS